MNRRIGLAMVGFAVTAAVLYFALAPAGIKIFGYTLRTHFENVSQPLLRAPVRDG